MISCMINETLTLDNIARRGGRAVECSGLEIQTSAKSRLAGVHGFLAFLSRFPHR